MSIRHHLDEATLLSYVAGSLSQGMALVVASHLSMCAECRNRVAKQEAVGGSLLENLAPAAISSSALDDVLARLDQTETAQPQPERQSDSSLPAPLYEALGCSLRDVAWKKIVAGIHYFDLPYTAGGVTRLLKIAPGKTLLPHGHQGNELTLVLEGSFCDDIGRFARGDIADLDEQVEHQPLVDSQTDCICLIATDGPLKFTTLLGRLVQPVTGF